MRFRDFGATSPLIQAIQNAPTESDPFVAALIAAMWTALGPPDPNMLQAGIKPGFTDITPPGATAGDSSDPFKFGIPPADNPNEHLWQPTSPISTTGEVQYWILSVNGGPALWQLPQTGLIPGPDSMGAGGGLLLVAKYDTEADAAAALPIIQALDAQQEGGPGNPSQLTGAESVFQVGNYIVWDQMMEGASQQTDGTFGPLFGGINSIRTQFMKNVLAQPQIVAAATGATASGVLLVHPVLAAPGSVPASTIHLNRPLMPFNPDQAAAAASPSVTAAPPVSTALATAPVAPPTDYTPWLVGGGIIAALASLWWWRNRNTGGAA